MKHPGAPGHPAARILGAVGVICLGALVAVVLISLANLAPDSVGDDVAVESPRSTAGASPSAGESASVPGSPSQPTAEPGDPEDGRGITGVTVAEIRQALDEFDMTCVDATPTAIVPDLRGLQCEGQPGGSQVLYRAWIDYWDEDEVLLYRVSVLPADQGEAVPVNATNRLLVRLARIEYQGSEPDSAADWTASHIGDEACAEVPCITTIGGGRLVLGVGVDGIHYLEVSPARPTDG